MPKTVLVVDDDALFRQALSEGLRGAGYEVAQAADGLEALQKVREGPPDFILLDLIMPKLDGLRTCQLLKRHPRHQAIPVIFLTGLGPEGVPALERIRAEATVAKRQAPATLSDILRTLHLLDGQSPHPKVLSPAEAVRGLAERRIVSELLAERQYHEALLDTLGEGVVELDERGLVVYANAAGLDLLEQTEDALIGRPGFDLFGPANAPVLRQTLGEARAGRAGAAHRLELTCGNRTLGVTLTVLHRADGAPGALLVLRDLTEQASRTRSLQALAAVNQRQHASAKALLEVAQALAQTLEPERVFDLIAEKILAVTGADACGIARITAAGDLEYVRATGFQEPNLLGLTLLRGEGLMGRCLERGAPAWSRDLRGDPAISYRPERRARSQMRGGLAVPIVTAEGPYGVLFIGRRDPHEHPPEEVAFAEALAAQAALAIQNARLYDDAQRRAQEAAALAEVGRTLSGSLDLDRVLELVVQEVQRVMAVPFAGIMILDEARQELTYSKAAGLSPEHLTHVRLKVGEGIVGRAVAEGRPVQSPRVQDDPRYVSPGIAERQGFRALLTAPLMAGGRPLGALAIFRREEGEFSPREVQVLGQFADQAALALQNARLYKESEARRRTAEALTRVGRLLAQSLDPEEVAQRIAETVRGLLGAKASTLSRLDPESGNLVVLAVAGDAMPPFGPHFACPVGLGVAGLAGREGRPVSTPDVLTDPRITLTPEMRARAEQGLFRTGLAVPLVRTDQVVGVLAVGDVAGRVFTGEEVELAQAFADQAALALENARLYAEVRAHSAALEEKVEERTRELQALVRELETASRHKSEFLANMSHELRTPLNAVFGYTDLLLGAAGARPAPLTEQQERYLTHIRTGGQRLLDLINDLLDLAKIEAGRMTLDLRELAVPATLHEALIPARTLALQKGLALDLHLADTPPTIVADPRKFQQILGNLLSNAIKFTPTGGRITVEARGVPGPRGVALEVAVQDTGIGIAPQDQRRLFQEFVQLDSSLAKRHQGTGLGLALSKRLVKLHWGRIWAASPGPGQGATFTFRLPCRPAPLAGRVLVVDDEPTVRCLIREVLAERGLEVEEAADGPEALRRIAAAPPDLLLLDLGMPLMAGSEVIQDLRRRPETATLPILVVTGLGAEEGRIAVARGADAHLAKPFTPDALVEAVEDLLQRRGAGAGVTP